MPLNELVLKELARKLWKSGGENTLVKVTPRGMTPNASMTIGYCTTLKFVVGRTPAEMEAIVGFQQGSKLAHGAEIFLVNPLPLPEQFELRGYTQTPAGVSTSAAHYVPVPGFPPGLGAPQWELKRVSQSALKWIATVNPGQRFTYHPSGWRP